MDIRKVLVLAPSLKAVGGIQKYTESLAGALAAVLGTDCVRTVAVPGEPEARSDGTAALRLSVKLRFIVHAFIVAILWRPNLMICTHVGTATVALLIRRFTGIRYWLVLHGIEVWGDLPAAKSQALRGAQRYLALTRFVLDATIARHALGRPAHTILPPPLIHAEPTLSPADHFAPADVGRPIVLTVGRLAASEQYKGHDVMLEAWSAVRRCVPEAVYWIVGDGDDRARLESRAHELGIADSVRFAGMLSGKKLSACYETCCIFAMPATTELDANAPRGEGFGIVFLEAMAHAKPVVAPRVGAPAELIRSGEHGLLVDPKDPFEVAQALIELLRDPARAQRMGKTAREWAVREFSYDKFRTRLSEALQQEPTSD